MLSAATYIMAIYIGNILDFLKYPTTPHAPRATPNIWTWLFGVPSQSSSAHLTNEDSGKHSGEESGKESVVSPQNLDPAHPKVMEEGKGAGFTMPPINGRT
jgi:hypothetical protein